MRDCDAHAGTCCRPHVCAVIIISNTHTFTVPSRGAVRLPPPYGCQILYRSFTFLGSVTFLYRILYMPYQLTLAFILTVGVRAPDAGVVFPAAAPAFRG